MGENDVVIAAACRTPNGRAARGVFRGLKNDELMHIAIAEALRRARLDPGLVEDVVLGHVLSPMNGSVAARMAALHAGIPVQTPAMTVNRQCGSGMEAIGIVADRIRLGRIEVGLAGGFESMTSCGIPREHNLRGGEGAVQDCLLPLGEVSELLAERYGVTREMADEYAVESQRRALDARDRISREIVRVDVGGETVRWDEGVRETSLEKIRSLQPVFRENGTSTAANSSQLSDGACAVVLMRRGRAEELGTDVLGELVDVVSVGVEPRYMGIGPAAAIPVLLERNGLRMEDVSCFEINEAFASQVLSCLRELGMDGENVNRYGGSIALGHPLGASGARVVCTLLNVMRTEGLHGYGVASLCIGSGQGIAALVRVE